MSGEEECDCGKPAVWIYTPSKQGHNPYFCNECVPRGCSCNTLFTESALEKSERHMAVNPPEDPNLKWKWIDRGLTWCYLDERGREFPCVEYDYLENDCGE